MNVRRPFFATLIRLMICSGPLGVDWSKSRFLKLSQTPEGVKVAEILGHPCLILRTFRTFRMQIVLRASNVYYD